MIIYDDADVEAVIENLRAFSFYNAGQDCTQPCRYYVADRIYDNFVADFASAISLIKTGQPDEADVEMGPIITADQFCACHSSLRRPRPASILRSSPAARQVPAMASSLSRP